MTPEGIYYGMQMLALPERWSANNKRKEGEQMPLDALLDDRKVTILKAIIKTYLETGEPVGSRTISKYSDLKLSSATIRK